MTSVYDEIMANLYGLWRHRWYGVATMWAVCLIGWIVVANIPDQYEATARIFIDVNNDLGRLTDDPATNNVFKQVDTVKRTLINHQNLEKVMRLTDLDLNATNEAETEKVIERLTRNITLKSQSDDLFTISYRSGERRLTSQENANLAKKVVQNLITIFTEGNLGNSRDTLNSAIRFLDERLVDLKAQLEQFEKAKADFYRTHVGAMPGSDNFQSRLQEARTQLQTVGQRIAELRSAKTVVSAEVASTPKSVPGSSGPIVIGQLSERVEDPNGTAGQIAATQRLLADLQARGLTEQHPDIINAKLLLSNLRKQYEQEKKAAPKKGADVPTDINSQPNPVYAQAKLKQLQITADLAAAEGQQRQLAALIADLESKTASMPTVAAEASKVDRDYEVTHKNYEEMLQRREKAKEALAAEAGAKRFDIKIIDAPEVPLKPVAPNRLLLLTGVYVVSLALGVAVSFVLSRIHTTYISVDKLREGLGMSVLGSVSAVLTDYQRNQARVWMSAFFLIFGSLMVTYIGLMVYEFTQAARAI